MSGLPIVLLDRSWCGWASARHGCSSILNLITKRLTSSVLHSIFATVEPVLAQVGHRWKHALGLRFGGNLDAAIGASACGAAYAMATGGVFFDTEANEILTAEKALQAARDIERDLP